MNTIHQTRDEQSIEILRLMWGHQPLDRDAFIWIDVSRLERLMDCDLSAAIQHLVEMKFIRQQYREGVWLVRLNNDGWYAALTHQLARQGWLS
jgi:uncharacterized protein HemY